jgi:hypothetical protein
LGDISHRRNCRRTASFRQSIPRVSVTAGTTPQRGMAVANPNSTIT